MGQEQHNTSTTSATPDDVVGLARLLAHAKENNIAYLVAVAVAFQMGILQKIWTYGAGVC